MPLPTPGTDTDTWGATLNAWLLIGHNTDGTNKEVAIPYSIVKRNASHQSIATATLTSITFDQVRSGLTWWASTPNPTRLTVPSAGTYLVGGALEFDLSGNGTRQGAIHKNGSDLCELVGGWVPYATDNTVLSIGGVPVVCAANDYFELKAWQTSGVALNAVSDTNSPLLWAVRIGA